MKMKVYRNRKMQQEILRTYDRLLTLWDVKKEELEVDTTYGTTHVIICGKKENPPLILFHGVGDDSALMWIYNAKFLSQYYRIYAIDTIGGPGKSVPGKAYNKDFDDILWIDQVLDKLEISKAFLQGYPTADFWCRYMLCAARSVCRRESAFQVQYRQEKMEVLWLL